MLQTVMEMLLVEVEEEQVLVLLEKAIKITPEETVAVIMKFQTPVAVAEVQVVQVVTELPHRQETEELDLLLLLHGDTQLLLV